MSKIQRAFITGASSGIGEELVKLLSKEGVALCITGRSEAKLNELAAALQSPIQVLVTDLQKSSERKALISQMKEFQPDIIINNAGLGLYGEIIERETQDHLNLIEVNIAALTEITIEGAKLFKSQNRPGTILNVSSVAGLQLSPCFAVYAATKAYVTLFSESVDAEMKPYGIRVLTACPGQVETQFAERAAGRPVERTFGVMEVSFAAKEIWNQVLKQKSLHIFDWRYRLAAFFTRYVLPKSLIAKYLKKTIRSRYR